MRRTTVMAFLLAIAMLAFPAHVLAQSAGDDQYVDPLGGQNGGGNTNGNTSSTGAGGGSPSGGSGGGGGTNTTLPTTQAAAPSSTATSAAQGETGPTAPGELPRTGFDVILTIELGLAMLLCGVVVQRMVVLRDRRDHT
jgi:hypothetical protein